MPDNHLALLQAAVVWPGLRDEGAHRGEHQDLHQDRAAGAGVVVAVQFVVQAAVGPGVAIT